MQKDTDNLNTEQSLIIPPKTESVQGIKWHVFISYATVDIIKVHQIVKSLKKQGLKTWIDEERISLTDSIPIAIEDALEQSKTMVACFSPAYFASEQTRRERASFLHSDPMNESNAFIPVVIEDCTIPRSLIHLKHKKLIEPNEEELTIFSQDIRSSVLKTMFSKSNSLDNSKSLELNNTEEKKNSIFKKKSPMDGFLMKRIHLIVLIVSFLIVGIIVGIVASITSNKDSLFSQEDPNDSQLVAENGDSESYSGFPEESIAGIPLSTIDDSKIVYSEQLSQDFSFFLPSGLADYGVPIPQHIDSSYFDVQSASYENLFIRDHATFMPKFADEIIYPGAEAIKSYYYEQALLEMNKDNNYRGWFDIQEDIVLTESAPIYLYDYKDYAVVFAAPYVAVVFITIWYGGGMHENCFYSIDNFNMETGAKLFFRDICGTSQYKWNEVAEILMEQIETDYGDRREISIAPDIRQYFISGIGAPETKIDSSIKVMIDKDGLRFFFDPYEIGSFSEGHFEVVVPYEKLEGILEISPPKLHADL